MSDVLLSTEGLRVGYAGADVVRDVRVVLRGGDDVALVGRSGSGKTTLLLAMAGLLTPSAGRVSSYGLSRRDIAVVFQSPSLLPDLSALENVALPLRLSGQVNVADARERAAHALADLDITALDALPGRLSGGQQQRVAVARVLAAGPRVILADEPTGALDPQTAARVMTALRAHCDRVDGALLVATHDATVAAAARTTWHLDDGRLAA